MPDCIEIGGTLPASPLAHVQLFRYAYVQLLAPTDIREEENSNNMV